MTSDSTDNLSTAALSTLNMEALLETEDELASWDADRLMLEIDDALSDASDRTVSVSPRDLPILSSGDLPDGIHSIRHGKDSSLSASAKHLHRSNILTDEFGMPLAIFTKVCCFDFCAKHACFTLCNCRSLVLLLLLLSCDDKHIWCVSVKMGVISMNVFSSG